MQNLGKSIEKNYEHLMNLRQVLGQILEHGNHLKQFKMVLKQLIMDNF